MGNFISQSVHSLLRGYNRDARILMLGLDAAGKTTVMYQYKLGETCRTIPTIGFNVESIQINKINVTMWDIGGQNKIRPLWKYYYSGTQALIWVVDSADVERFDETKEELHQLLQEPELENCSVLILANKSDLAGPNVISKMHNTLQLDSLSTGKDRKWHIQPCCATSGEGLLGGMNWLCEQLKTQ